MKTVSKILLLAGLLLSPAAAKASGIQVSPPKFYLEMTAGNVTVVNIIVANPTNQTQLFKIYPDSLTNIVKPQLGEFALGPGQRKSVGLVLDLTSWPKTSSTLTTQVSVVSQTANETELNTATGVKIPLIIKIAPAPKNFRFPPQDTLWLALPLALALGFLLGKRNQKTTTLG